MNIQDIPTEELFEALEGNTQRLHNKMDHLMDQLRHLREIALELSKRFHKDKTGVTL